TQRRRAGRTPLPVALLSVVAVPATVVALPVATPPVPAPRPVPTSVHEVALEVDAEAAAAVEVDGAERTLVLTPRERTPSFSTLGVTWARDDGTGTVTVRVRTRGDDGWTPWSVVEAEEAEVTAGAPDDRRPDLRAGTEPLFTGPSDGVQVRLDVEGGAAPQDVRLALVDPGTSPADAPAAAPRDTAEAAYGQPVIRSRAQWGADESIRKGTPSYASTISAATVHHTASSNDYTAADVPRLIRGFYAYHVQSLGWSDIGYNVLVDKFGTAWEGRAGGLDRPVIGAHAGGFNTGTVGISMIGTYGDVEPPAAMKEAVAQVAAWKLDLHGRDPKSSVTMTSGGSTRYAAGTQVTLPRIFGHLDVSSTACPGQRGYATLPWLRDRAAALIASAPSSPTPSPTTATPTASPGSSSPPFGELDEVTATRGARVRVRGWAIDSDAPAHTVVEVRVDGATVASVVADQTRADLRTRYPQYTPEHGFDAVVEVPAGTRRVCLVALDQPGSSHTTLGCRTVEVPTGDPVGDLDTARAVTFDVVGVKVSGWALDPDVEPSSEVALQVDGRTVRTVLADRPRPDIPNGYPGYHDRRGFEAIIPAAPGDRTVCATVVNEGTGTDVRVKCLPVTVPERPAPEAPPGSRGVEDACPSTVPSGGFADTRTSVHRAAVDCAVWWRLTAGVTADRFAPQDRLTRGQVATFLARLLTEAGTALPAAPPDAFDDDRGSTHELAINQMAALGVVAGRGGRRYDPLATVTRDQMATYLTRAYEAHVGAPLNDGDPAWFADDDGSVHEAAIGRAARAGITGGTTPGRYAPLSPTDRGQVASFLVRVLDLMVEAGRTPRRS
ncbi:MAG TPA: N-acetylmuramoyl-L-alanine amidase, partial [Mycobacteriales bacterium]|nr:N-acetylmuramoyl-L-alanine amidase [Mycobacteriales bacterium]